MLVECFKLAVEVYRGILQQLQLKPTEVRLSITNIPVEFAYTS